VARAHPVGVSHNARGNVAPHTDFSHPMNVTKHLRIAGLVQGVGYRDAMVVQARLWGLRGWVRNRSDGSVEAVVVGEDADVQRLIQWAHRGPSGARIDSVTATEMTSAVVAGTFERRPTL
jgi:acylphosphatase